MYEYMDKNSIKGWQLKENSQEFDGVKSWGTPMVAWPQKKKQWAIIQKYTPWEK